MTVANHTSYDEFSFLRKMKSQLTTSCFNSSIPKRRSRYKLPKATDHDNGEEQLVLELLGAGELLQLVEGIESVQPEKKESEYGEDEAERR